MNASPTPNRQRIRVEDAEDVTGRMGYDGSGLDRLQRACLEALARSRRPISLKRLARLLGTTARNLEENVEPELEARGLLEITERGRVAAHGPRIARA